MERTLQQKRNFIKILLLSACLLTSFLPAADHNAERVAQAGELSVQKNHRVLRLFGKDIFERGFAGGYLLAEEIRDDLDAVLESLPHFDAAKYETMLLPWAKKNFVWDADARAELDGIFAGMSARLANNMHSKVLKRAMTRDDLTAINTIADYFGPACSGFSAWGADTDKGELVHGRTLDFPIGAKAVADQVIVVSEALPARADGRPARRSWIAVGWPGLLGQYTGMNADGVVVCLHDGYNIKKSPKEGGCIARGLLLRRMLEEVDCLTADPAPQAAKMAGAHGSACGNLFHLSWPAAAAAKRSEAPSAVLEFEPHDDTVQIRRATDGKSLVLTNHFRVRAKPVACERFKNISAGIELLEKAAKPIGLMEARKLLMCAEQPVAAHSVYFFPDRLVLQVALTRNNVMSPRVAPTEFSFKELLKPSADGR